MSDDVHIKFIFARGDGFLQNVNWVAIPPTTHYDTQWDRLSDCVRQPGHTAPWRHRQDDMVCCVPDSFAIEHKISQIVAVWCVADPDVIIPAAMY